MGSVARMADWRYPFIGDRSVANIPEIKTRSAAFALSQHSPLLGIKGAPEPPKVNPEWTGGRTLWECQAQAQDAVIEAYRPLVEWIVRKYHMTHSKDLLNRLCHAGYSHRVNVPIKDWAA